MPQVSFKEWVEQKAEEARSSERAQRRSEWKRAYRRLRASIEQWLREEAGEQIVFEDEVVQRNEFGLGVYDIDGFRIRIGDSSAHVVPVSRNVIARINSPDGGELPGEGLVDITGGGGRFHVYRTIQDGTDVWYIVGERPRPLAGGKREPAVPLTKESLQGILMDLLS